MTDWQENLIESDEEIRAVIRDTKTIAVLGIKPESRSYKPAFYVPEYLLNAGFEIIPVPVYYPEVEEILGQRVFRSLAGIGREIDMVNVFRRSEHVAQHVDDIIAAHPKSVWIQSGIRDDVAAERMARAGIRVIQDRCLMVEHQGL